MPPDFPPPRFDSFGRPMPPELPPVLQPVRAPVPVLPLNYYRPATLGQLGNWVTLTRLRSTGQWHHVKAALSRGKIESLMGEGEDVARDNVAPAPSEGIELLVPENDLPRARLILDAVMRGAEWCPRCGSTSLQKLPLPWWWMFFAILFLGVPPWSPERFACESCGNRWE